MHRQVAPRLSLLLAIALLAIALPSIAPAQVERMEVFPAPAIAGEPLSILLEGSTISCQGDPTLREVSRDITGLVLELLDPGCPLLPPGGTRYAIVLPVDPFPAGSYTATVRTPEGIDIESVPFEVIAASSDGPTIRAVKTFVTEGERAEAVVSGSNRGCVVEPVDVEIRAPAGPPEDAAGSVDVVLELACILDPPLEQEFELVLELGALPLGSYELTTHFLDEEPEGGDLLVVGFDPDQPTLSVSPRLPTDRDTLTASIVLPGEASCSPAVAIDVPGAPTEPVVLTVDRTCIDSDVEGADTRLFVPFGPLPAGSYSVILEDEGGAELAGLDLDVLASGDCRLSETTLCLLRDRFAARALWRTGSGTRGPGHARVGASSEGGSSGAFWFFESGNVELDVKVLDGCAINGHYWVFAAGLTDVQVTLRVEDTVENGVRTYGSSLGDPFAPITDIEAFPCTP